MMRRSRRQAPAKVATVLLAELLALLMQRWEPAQVHAEFEARLAALLQRPPRGISRPALLCHARAILALMGEPPPDLPRSGRR